MSNPFQNPTVQHCDFVEKLNKALGSVYADAFWQSEPNKFTSSDAVRARADTVTLVMTRGQFETLFRRAQDLY